MRSKSECDQGIAESLEEFKKGQAYGPFKTADEMIRFLHTMVRMPKPGTSRGK